VHFDHTLGESFYEDMLSGVVQDLIDKGMAGKRRAICIFFPDHDRADDRPQAGRAFLIATTDLATIRYRMETWRPDAILYVVDHRQSLHFQQLLPQPGNGDTATWNCSTLVLATVLGEDNRRLKPDPATPWVWKACSMSPCARGRDRCRKRRCKTRRSGNSR